MLDGDTLVSWDKTMTEQGDLILSNKVKKIADNAFTGSNIQSVRILYGLTSIGDSAFTNSSTMSSIYIPNSVTSIGTDAFAGCTSLHLDAIEYMGPATGYPWGIIK